MSEAPEDDDPDGATRGRPRLLRPILLFAATFFSTTLSGAMNAPLTEGAKTFGEAAALALSNLSLGLPYAVALMSILVAHEAGHAIAAARHGVAASLPHFIPLPFTFIGTMGAVIGLRGEVRSRNALADIAAAGPLAGLAVALPVLAYGIHLSSVGPTRPGDLIEGQSLLYMGLKLLVKGELLPWAGRDLQLHPVAFAGWVGLLVTVINLIPVGPLDGGHLAAAALGKGHDRRSRRVHVVLPLVGAAVALWFGVAALRAGAGARAVSLGMQAGLPWMVWAGVLLLLRRLQGGRWQEPLGDEPLTKSRRWTIYLCAILFFLLFMPWVMREAT